MEKITRRENIIRTYRDHKAWFIPSVTDIDQCMPSVLNETPSVKGRHADDWGVIWLLLDGQPGPIQDETIPPVLEDVTEWKDVVHFPEVETYDWEGCAARDTANWDRENKISNVIIVNGLWERFYAVCGFQNALCNLLVEPEDTYDFLGAIADCRVEMIKKFAQYYKPDKIQIHDDYGTEKSLFMSVDTWRELIKPHLKRIVDACHENGMLYEHHSCGHIVPLIDDFIELGIDAWNPVQNTNHPIELAKKYAGKLTFVGGFNERLFVQVGATEEDKKESIIETVKAFDNTSSWIPQAAIDQEYQQFVYDTIYDANKPKYDALGLTGKEYERPIFTAMKSVYYSADDDKSEDESNDVAD